MNQEHVDAISRTLSSGLSRRRVVRALGVGGASGILAVVGHEASAADRPHENLQDRTSQRNRKQRNKNKNNKNKNKNNDNDNQTSREEGFFGLGTSVAYSHQNSAIYYIRVMGFNGDVNYVFGPHDKPAILSVTDEDGNDESAVTFIIDYPGWTDKLYIQAANYPFSEPSADYDKAQNVLNDDGSNPHASRAIVRSTTMSFHSLTVGASYQLDWEGKSFKVERQSDSSDYKMFLVTALA
jgi:hypothetical protein